MASGEEVSIKVERGSKGIVVVSTSFNLDDFLMAQLKDALSSALEWALSVKRHDSNTLVIEPRDVGFLTIEAIKRAIVPLLTAMAVEAGQIKEGAGAWIPTAEPPQRGSMSFTTIDPTHLSVVLAGWPSAYDAQFAAEVLAAKPEWVVVVDVVSDTEFIVEHTGRPSIRVRPAIASAFRTAVRKRERKT